MNSKSSDTQTHPAKEAQAEKPSASSDASSGESRGETGPVIYTIGHSTREWQEFVDILHTYRVKLLVDVRTVPKSRHVPQFTDEHMAAALPEAGIEYTHLKALGGLRSTRKDSPNGGWRNKSFRGYADYMQTDEFSEGVDELAELAKGRTTAIMCAEAVPWRCHRSMVGDALLVRGFRVVDIFSEKKAEPEKLTSFAEVNGTHIVYPPYE